MVAAGSFQSTNESFYHKVKYASVVIDPVIDGFSPNEVKSRLYTCDHSIITFGIRVLCLGFSNTSHVNILHRIRNTVVGKVRFDTSIFVKRYSKRENMEI